MEWRITSTGRTVSFSVARTAAWTPGVERSEPALDQMPAMLRRRAGHLQRMSCSVAYRAMGDAVGVPTIFCSRYGETARALELLTELAHGSALSPTAFSLSVHNAAGGLFSIARQDTANCIALAAGEESAALGVIEAAGLLADGAAQVLLVFADCPLPQVFARFEDAGTAECAWACLLQREGSDRVELSWETVVPAVSTECPPPAALQILRFFQGGDAELIHTIGGRRWRWSRRA